MPFQSIFLNALQNDIENNQLWQQTAAALQSNKFVQVMLQQMINMFFRFFFKKFCNSTDYLKEQSFCFYVFLHTLLMFPI